MALGEVMTRPLIASLVLIALFAIPPTSADEPRFNAVGPPLGAIGAKIAEPHWLVAWLSQPSKLRHATVMPDFDLAPDEVRNLATYLLVESAPAPRESTWRGGDAQTGAALFVSRGCRGCHAIEPDESSLSPRVPNLAGIGLKARGAWLFDWISSPRSYDPRTPMPKLVLTEAEIRDLVAFLLTRRDGAGVVAAAPRFTPGDTAAGRTDFETYECANCHSMKGYPLPPPPFQLAPGDGSDVALRNGRTLVAYYNCRGCHRIEGSGGAIADYLERKTFAPPTLEGEGDRVQPSWLIGFLHQPTPLRPWLKMHMPTFGFDDAEATALARYFATLAGVPATDEPVPDANANMVALGLRRIAHYKCDQCHPTGSEPPPGIDHENLSINLMLAKTRLRPSWIQRFLKEPKAIVGSQTRMPAVFYTSDGHPKVEHPLQDIDAITAYLLHMTEPLNEALADLAEHRKAEDQQEQIDWTKIRY